MKKTQLKTLAIVLIFFTSMASKAQDLYLLFNLGYGHSAAPNLFNAAEYEDINGTETYKRIKGSGSFGSGIQGNIGAGIEFNKTCAAELLAGYFYGLKNVTNSKSQNQAGSTEGKNTIQGSMVRIMPSIRFSAEIGKCKPYMKTGAVIGLFSKLISEDKFSSNSQFGSNFEYVMEFKGRASLGFTASLGCQFPLSEKLNFFSEINMITQSWAPKKSVITKYMEDGEDQLPNMTTYEKETEYVDKYTDSYDCDVPSKEIKYFMPFSSIGLQFGLVFRL